MTYSSQARIESEQKTVRNQLAHLPDTALLTRRSLEERLEKLDREWRELSRNIEPARAMLTFKGRPVLGSQGIYADFAAAATSAFTDAVSRIGAGLFGDLASRGPIPHGKEFRLVIRGTAIGSFGFELEEDRPEGQLFHADSPTSEALAATCDLLVSSLHDPDDDLAEMLSLFPIRAIDALRVFVEQLQKNEATCHLVVGSRDFRFSESDDVNKTLRRLAKDNLHETEKTLIGEFLGFLPNARTFEFRVLDTGSTIRGKVSPTVVNPYVVNHHLNQPVEIQVVETTVGSGSPRYRLSSLPVSWAN